MNEQTQIRNALGVLHASGDCIQEVLSMAEKQKSRGGTRLTRRFALIAAAAVLILSLAFAAAAHNGMWDWLVSLHRNAETEQRGAIAREAAERFVQQAPGAGDAASVGTDTEKPAPELVMDETVFDLENGYTYRFSVPEWERSAGNAYVQVDDAGRITWLDMRMLYPYPKPENCPQEYMGELFDLDAETMEPIEGSQREVFYADLYLREVAYPDPDAYNDRIRKGALEAVDFLPDEGYLDFGSGDVAFLCFDMFSGGSAQIDALMDNGDICHIYLQPDDLTPTGFLLRTAEELDGKGWRERYDALFEAARNHTQAEYRDTKQAEYAATGVG